MYTDKHSSEVFFYYLQLLTAMFIDEWNVLVRAQVGFTLTLKFSLFGKEYSISFDDLIAGTTDMYMSVGGM